MTTGRTACDTSYPWTISRRHFIKLAAAGLLAGCSPVQQPTAAPTSAPTVTPTSVPTATLTSLPTATPTTTPTVTPAPTATPVSIAAARQVDIVKVYPEVASRVVRARHPGVWDGETLVPGAIRQMLDASVTQLTGLSDAGEAWASLFDPDERIAIKVNTIRSSRFWTHIPLAMAVTECLQEIGVPAEQIVVFDRATGELKKAGYPVNEDGPGVRCYGTSGEYTGGWTLAGRDIELSSILLSCHALINIPLLKQHDMSGISFAMKNHYGTFSRPSAFHGNMDRAIPELNALSPIRDRTRLIIGDALAVCERGWYSAVTGDSILMSFDPVAHDTVGLRWYESVMADQGRPTKAERNAASYWLENAPGLGIGTNDLDHIDLVEVSLPS